MKVVIDIPKTHYDMIVKEGDGYFEGIIKNGTPLPKGHGRIADMDEAIKCIEECEGEDAIWAISLIEWACSKRTLIEADNAESEDNESDKSADTFEKLLNSGFYERGDK